jgi:hypothetical protein
VWVARLVRASAFASKDQRFDFGQDTLALRFRRQYEFLQDRKKKLNKKNKQNNTKTLTF